ncbi:LPS export ABC transporter periplasmic protein LptC [Roseicitreum antarcticum]|uniref:Lipopolysaccharide export system protein LptC n=1 Tax=Roseicitreum antarcticum TaxID=564137 RepID=A0A1H2X7P6_9RHOB|nr:LPS export ABC transporter periplasmic protein LptC [Roseicitreum antarcticum]SDW88279.1 lipopolysaccharide export system protein LptC [Roseicitreum antarcticum]
MKQADRYSRSIAVLKLVLPLGALGLLSSLFLVARDIDPSQAISNAPVDVAELAREPRISGANYAGVTDDGAALTIAASTARADPDATLRLTLTDMRATLETPDGEVTQINAGLGVLDRAAGRVEWRDDVQVTAAQGYALNAAQLFGLLDDTRLWSDQPVLVQGPVGEIRAGQFALQLAEGGARTYVMLFSGGVNLLYDGAE